MIVVVKYYISDIGLCKNRWISSILKFSTNLESQCYVDFALFRGIVLLQCYQCILVDKMYCEVCV